MDFFSSKYNDNYLDKVAYKGLLDFFLQLILKPSLSTLGWLTVMEYLCHKWPRICSTCRKHFSVLCLFMTYHRGCNYSNTMDATSRQEMLIPSEQMSSPPVFSGVRVILYLVLCAMLYRSLFVL